MSEAQNFQNLPNNPNQSRGKSNNFPFLVLAVAVFLIAGLAVFVFVDKNKDLSVGANKEAATNTRHTRNKTQPVERTEGKKERISTSAMREMTAAKKSSGKVEYPIDSAVSAARFLMNPENTASGDQDKFTTENHKMRLITPNGETLAPKSERPEGVNIDNIDGISGGGYFSSEGVSAGYNITDPQAGIWTVTYNPDFDVSLSVKRESQKRVEVTALPQNPQAGDTVEVVMDVVGLEGCTDREVMMVLTQTVPRETNKSWSLPVSEADQGDTYRSTTTVSSTGSHTVSGLLRCQSPESPVVVQRWAVNSIRVSPASPTAEVTPGRTSSSTEGRVEMLDQADPLTKKLYKARMKMQRSAQNTRPAFQFFNNFDSPSAIRVKRDANKQFLQDMIDYRKVQKELITSPVVSDRFEDETLNELTSERISHDQLRQFANAYLDRIVNIRKKLESQRSALYDIAIEHKEKIIVNGDEADAENISFTDDQITARWNETLETVDQLESQLDDIEDGRVDNLSFGQKYIKSRTYARLFSFSSSQ